MILRVQEHKRLTRKKILFAAFLIISAWIVCRNCLLSPVDVQQIIVTDNRAQNICLYYPSTHNYALRLQPKENVFPLNELEPGDYQKLIDLKDFTFSINEPSKCLNSNVLLLVVVTSAAQNIKRRNAIRTTWGQQDSKVRVLFMLGTVMDNEIQESVKSEHQKFGDIVQGNFIDSYRNLTYKTVMTLKYAVYHCPNAIYIFKTDDDVFINMPLMKNYLMNDLSPFGAQKLIQCIVFTNQKPIRVNSKWAVTEEEYPDSKYPIYCNGAWALFSPDVLFKLYREAQKIKFLFLEDVFLYGIAGSKIKDLVHQDIRNLTLSYKWFYGLAQGEFDNRNFLIGTFGLYADQLKEFWNYVLNKPVRSSVYDYSKLDDL